LAYFLSLKDGHVAAEMHLYTLGGHDFEFLLQSF
jgi:hypothetical protein